MAFKPISGKITKEQTTIYENEKEQLKKKAEEELITLQEERIYRESEVSIRDLISPAAFKVESSFLQLGDIYCRTIFISAYPRYISVGWSSPVISLASTMDIGMFFYPVKSAIILKQLKNKVGALEAQLSADREKGAPRDPLRETALRDIEQLRDNLTQGTEHFFQFCFYVTIYAKDKKELDQLSEDIEGIFGSKLIITHKVFYQAEQGFNSTLPMCNDELYIPFNLNSSPIAASFPFISAELTSDNGIFYGINRHNNSLIVFDRFSLQNANMVVFASSGAGKSYAIKLEIIRSLMMGIDIIVIDPEMEYKHLCDAVGGTYVNISLSSEAKINPFDLPKQAGGLDMSVEDIIRSAIITTKGLLKIMLGGLTAEQDSIIDKALLEAYAKKDITRDADLTKAQPPIMQDLQEVLEGMTNSEELVLKLSKFTEGTFSGLFNSPTNVDLNNQLMIFGVRDLELELRPMAIYTIVNFIWNIVRSERKKRILVIDEAWWLMKEEDSANFISSLVKRCRKYYLGITTITQDVNDFLRSQFGQPIITNSALQLLLKQAPAAIDLVQQTFSLTDSERLFLLKSPVGNGIFFAGNKHAAIQITASNFEDQIVTTNPEQLLEIEKAKKEFEEQLLNKE